MCSPKPRRQYLLASHVHRLVVLHQFALSLLHLEKTQSFVFYVLFLEQEDLACIVFHYDTCCHEHFYQYWQPVLLSVPRPCFLA